MSEQIQQLLNLETAPVAVTFHDTHPESISRVEKVEASSCTYWRDAQQKARPSIRKPPTITTVR